MQPVITHSITDLKSCEAVLKIMLAKNPNVGMIIVSEQAQQTIFSELETIAQRYAMRFRSGLSVMGVKLRTRAEQDALEQAHREKIERSAYYAKVEEEDRQHEARIRLKEEQRKLIEDQFDASKPLEKWVEYKRGLGRLKGPKWRSFK